MATQQKHTVYGYVREIFGVNQAYPLDIIQIIYNYYLITIASNILTPSAQTELLDFLYGQLKSRHTDEDIKSIDTKLLFRASECGYNGEQFETKCADKGPTISIIHTEYDFVFGGYVSVSWGAKLDSNRAIDTTAFLFRIRPTIKYYPLKDVGVDSKGVNAAWSDSMGFAYGGGADVWVDDCKRKHGCGCQNPGTFEFDPSELCGGDPEVHRKNKAYFVVNDYEIFSINIS